MLLARTDWDAPKHRGITYFALPMRQPGVEVRPLRQMNEHSSFNEVFMTDARIRVDHVVGNVATVGGRARRRSPTSGARCAWAGRGSRTARGGPSTRRSTKPRTSYFAIYAWYPQRAGRVDLVVDRGRARRVAPTMPSCARRSPRLLSMQRARDGPRTGASGTRAGRPPGAEGSIGKLALSKWPAKRRGVHGCSAGADGMLTGPDSLVGGIIAEILVSVPAQSIAGGTDEIQHNILGEKVLGLSVGSRQDRIATRRSGDFPRNG